jgi:hypothetical protein
MTMRLLLWYLLYTVVYSTGSVAQSSIEARRRQQQLTVTAQFEATWGNSFTENSEKTVRNCISSSKKTLLVLSCENGASIEYVRTGDSSLSWTMLSDSVLQCTSDESALDNHFSSLVFVSLALNNH